MKRLAISFLFTVFLLSGCNRDNDPSPDNCPVIVDFDGSSIRYCPGNTDEVEVKLERPQDEFIWQALNLFYLWQPEVPDLADDRFENFSELNEFLNAYSSTEELFKGLKFSEDRFSRIYSNYVELENALQGVSKSFGYEFRLLRETEGGSELFGYIKFVVPGGPADLKGLSRGTIFNKVDGQQLTVDNYEALLYDASSYQLSLARIEGGLIVDTNEIIELVAVQLDENAIFLSDVLDVSGRKLGYLVYNQFINNNQAHRELNEVFGRFNNEGINELVIDLRYNPGGSVTTTRLLASMIYAGATSNTNFGIIQYNTKLAEYFNREINFYDKLPIFNEDGAIASEESLNRLNGLSRVFVITSGSTASASELLTVGLSPYLNVITIGTTTVGKNVGSTTLYDSKKSLFLKTENAEINDKHQYALLPITSRLANSEGFSDYAGGLEPDVIIDEKDFLAELKPLGDPQEPLLAEVMAIIDGVARQRVNEYHLYQAYETIDPFHEQLQTVFIEPAYIPEELMKR